MSETRHVALLRGINVGGKRKIPMADLRSLAADLGYSDVETHLQSGNLVFTSDTDVAGIGAALEAAISQEFGFDVPVAVRTAEQWLGYVSTVPFADAAEARPKLLHLGVAKSVLEPDAERILSEAATNERVSAGLDVIWVDYVDGVARSKLTSASLDRAAGSMVTARNWNTVLAIGELFGV
jgi:uncharacterized protein (DUF1697 family)